MVRGEVEGRLQLWRNAVNWADPGTRVEEALALFACTHLSLTPIFQSLVLPSLHYQTGLFHGAEKTATRPRFQLSYFKSQGPASLTTNTIRMVVGKDSDWSDWGHACPPQTNPCSKGLEYSDWPHLGPLVTLHLWGRVSYKKKSVSEAN